jgi:hypothetical protein
MDRRVNPRVEPEDRSGDDETVFAAIVMPALGAGIHDSPFRLSKT